MPWESWNASVPSVTFPHITCELPTRVVWRAWSSIPPPSSPHSVRDAIRTFWPQIPTVRRGARGLGLRPEATLGLRLIRSNGGSRRLRATRWLAPPTTVASHSGSRAHSCVAFSPATVRRIYILPALAANAATTSQKRGGAEPTAAELDALFLSVCSRIAPPWSAKMPRSR